MGNRNSLEEKLVTAEGIDFLAIDVQKLYRKLTAAHLKFPGKLLRSIRLSSSIIREFQPDAFLGTGGFVSGPVGWAARCCHIPVFLQEQNSFPGLTTRILSRRATKIFLGNQGAAQYLPKEKLIFSGNPINRSAVMETAGLDLPKLGLQKNKPVLLILGGSQGSLAINNALLPVVRELNSAGIQLLWQAGEKGCRDITGKLKKQSGVYVFAYTSEIGRYYNSADFVLARAGALTLAELEVKKLPALLIPLPSAAGNHQYFNALEMEKKGVALLIKQSDMTPDTLRERLLELAASADNMRQNFQPTPHLHAARLIAENIMRRI